MKIADGTYFAQFESGRKEKVLFVYGLFFFVFSLSSSSAEQSPCLNYVENFSEESLEYRVCEKFSWTMKEEQKSKILLAFKYLDGLEGRASSDLHYKSFGFYFSGKKYVDWILDRVDIYKVMTMKGLDPASYIRAKTDRDWLGNNITILNSKALNDPLLFTISTLIHEARHSKKNGLNHPHPIGDFPHSICSKVDIEIRDELPLPDSTNSYMCDTWPYGPVSMEIIFLKNLIDHCENCSRQDKKLAWYIIRRIKLSKILNSGHRLELQNELFSKGEILSFRIENLYWSGKHRQICEAIISSEDPVDLEKIGGHAEVKIREVINDCP